MKTQLTRLCAMTNANACPVISVDDSAIPAQAVEISDDFGGKAQMSREQLGVFVREAKSGKFDSALQA
jgi:hypothetical protein